MFGRKTDKECAQQAVATVVVAGKAGSKEVMDKTMTTDEIQRAVRYLESGQTIHGK